MSIAALYDIHGNLPALEAVLAEVRTLHVDQIVVGGDVLPGPMPCATLALLLESAIPVRFIHGNGELAVLAQVGVDGPDAVTYWGTTSGKPLPEPLQAVLRWTAEEVHPTYGQVLRSWPKTLRLEVAGLGHVLFCHGTPRSEVECFTRLTPVPLLAPVFESVAASVVVCGHTHMPFDRMIADTRVVNAGSVGMLRTHRGRLVAARTGRSASTHDVRCRTRPTESGKPGIHRRPSSRNGTSSTRRRSRRCSRHSLMPRSAERLEMRAWGGSDDCSRRPGGPS